jgi:hypothetical protein
MSRVVVTIHGTGRTEHDFWLPQMQALAEHLGSMPRHQPVWWGDMIDAGACVSAVGNWLVEHLHSLARKFLGRPSKHVARAVARVIDILHRFVDGVDGVVAYFVTRRRREMIRNRLRETLADLTRAGDEIVLVSESLGCLVAFDVLRAEADQYNVVAWITLGCALRTLVRTRRRRADLGAINPRTVGAWLNVYAPRDLVAAPIASTFPDYPIRDERIDGTRGRLQSHRYWANPRVAALIARVLRQ